MNGNWEIKKMIKCQSQWMFKKLLMMKAAEDLKKQQMLKEQERQDVLNKRIVPLPDLDSKGDGWRGWGISAGGIRKDPVVPTGELQRTIKEFSDRIVKVSG